MSRAIFAVIKGDVGSPIYAFCFVDKWKAMVIYFFITSYKCSYQAGLRWSNIHNLLRLRHRGNPEVA